MIQVRRATREDLETMAEVLSRAFADEPWTRWTVAAEGHLERIRQTQWLYLEFAALPCAMTWLDEPCSAVAAFMPPGAPALPGDVAQTIAALHGDVDARMQELELPSPPEVDAWSLATVGVEPAHQRTGRGSAVIRAGLQALDARGVGVHLQTSSDANLALYQRLGFEVFARTATRGPMVWSMWRPAAGRRSA